MAQGMPYDSDGGRAWAAAITALMTGHAYATSARTAARMGPFAGYAENAEPMLNVLRMHRAEAAKIDEDLVPPELLGAAQQSWDDAVELGERYGVRNSQATVLAPTGTIGLMMDCDTTGIEPDLALTKAKKLVGGGTMFIVNQTIPRALRNLGYSDDEVDAIVAYIDEHKTIIGAPRVQGRAPAGVRVLDGRQHDPLHGSRQDDGAVQPFISRRDQQDREHARRVDASKTSRSCYIESWRLGLKAVALYRDNCKVGQPLVDAEEGGRPTPAWRPAQEVERIVETVIVQEPVRQKLPRTRDREDVLVPGRRLPRLRDGRRVRRRPSRRDVPQGRQAGLDPRRHHGRVRDLGEPRPAVRRAARGVRRDVHEHALRARGHDRRSRHPVRDEPRRLHLPPAGGGVHADKDKREAMGILTVGERLAADAARCRGGDDAERDVDATCRSKTRRRRTSIVDAVDEHRRSRRRAHGCASAEMVLCHVCGDIMQRAGSCYACPSCGSTSGCS